VLSIYEGASKQQLPCSHCLFARSSNPGPHSLAAATLHPSHQSHLAHACSSRSDLLLYRHLLQRSQKLRNTTNPFAQLKQQRGGMHRFTLNWAGGFGRGLPFLTGGLGGGVGAAGGRAAVAIALAGGTVSYVRSFPREVPRKDPADAKCVRLRWGGGASRCCRQRAKTLRLRVPGWGCCTNHLPHIQSPTG